MCCEKVRKMYDIAIIGAGPAGLTAAVYARRAEKSVLVIEKETFGGQITHSPKIENYPGTLQMSGNEFAEKLIEQAMNLGAEIELDEVTGIKNEDGFKKIIGENAVYEAKSVIIATGSKHRTLGTENEESFVGRGVSYCAVCDGAFYRGKDVAVIGGGNTALQEAVMLSEFCKKVTLVQNLAFFTGEKRLLELLKKKPNVEFITSSIVCALDGNDSLSSVRILNTETNEEKTLVVDGVFVAIGQMPENEPFKEVSSLDDYGYIISGEECESGTDGIFVAGDCRTKRVRQIATAVSDGAVAAVNACKYVDSLE